MPINRTAGLIGVLVALAGCAHQPHRPVTASEQTMPKVDCNAQVLPEERVTLEMVDTLMARDQPYAALAHLQDRPQNNQKYWQRYGQAQARTGDFDGAMAVFTAMRDRCESGEAYHGVGIVNLKQGYLTDALEALELAVNKSPASHKARNDYGYALLLQGSYPAASRHLRTALELNNGQGPARQNLAMVYLLQDLPQKIVALKEQYHFTEDELEHARRLANQLRR